MAAPAATTRIRMGLGARAGLFASERERERMRAGIYDDPGALLWETGVAGGIVFADADDDRLFPYAGTEAGPFGANVPATMTVGGTRFLQCTRAAQNDSTRSEELDIDGAGAPWQHDAGVTSVTADDAAGPDGVVSADLVEYNTGASEWLYQALAESGLPDDVNCVISIAHKNGPTGNGQFRLQARSKAASITNSQFSAGASWSRDQHSFDVENGANDPRFYLRNGTTVAVREILFARAQWESGVYYAGPPVRTGATAKSIPPTLAYTDTPPVYLLEGIYQVKLFGDWLTGELQTGEVRYLFYRDINHYLAVGNSGGTIYAVLRTAAGTIQRAFTVTSRYQIVTLTVDLVAGSITVANATTGDGTTGGSTSVWIPARIYVGSNDVGGNHFDGGIGEPLAVAA